MARTSLPFVERQYRPDTRRLGDLMAQRRQDAIDARLREADINSRMVTGLAGAIGGTLSDIVNIQAQAPARKAAAEKQRREADAATRAENVNRIVDDTARLGLPKSQVADQMAQFGFGRESEAMRAEATKERQSLVSQSLASINARLDIMGQAEETAQQIERRPGRWQSRFRWTCRRLRRRGNSPPTSARWPKPHGSRRLICERWMPRRKR
jgi:hypothetical protein